MFPYSFFNVVFRISTIEIYSIYAQRPLTLQLPTLLREMKRLQLPISIKLFAYAYLQALFITTLIT